MVKASGPGRRNPMIKIRELVSTVGSLRYEEVDGVRKEKERLTTDHQPQGNVRWLMVVNLSLFSFVPLTINQALKAPSRECLLVIISPG